MVNPFQLDCIFSALNALKIALPDQAVEIQSFKVDLLKKVRALDSAVADAENYFLQSAPKSIRNNFDI